jgi:hypothetical protein
MVIAPAARYSLSWTTIQAESDLEKNKKNK